MGRVKSLDMYMYPKGYPQLRKGRILKPACTGKSRNYLTVRLAYGKAYKVHRLVAEAFIPNLDNLPMINHKDENTFNNCVDNLEWCTNSYNVKYSAKPLSDEHKQKIREKNLGKSLTEEHKQKLRDISLKRFANKEERDKLSRAVKLWWSDRKCKIEVNNSRK